MGDQHNLLFVTVGTSAITNELLGTLNGKDNSALREAVQDYESDATKLNGQMGRYGGLFSDLVRANREFWQTDPGVLKRWIAEKRFFRATSAELLSTYLLCKKREFFGEHLVLLASDTPEGWLAARVNQSVFHSIEYQERLGFRPLARIETVAGLDKEPAAWFDEIGQVITNEGRGQAFYRVNLTGGYKSVALALGYHAARNPGNPKYHLYYLHESLNVPLFLVEGKLESEGEDVGDW